MHALPPDLALLLRFFFNVCPLTRASRALAQGSFFLSLSGLHLVDFIISLLFFFHVPLHYVGRRVVVDVDA